ncbi:MAG: hypothetical protein ACUVRM_05725 [Bacillota bacterium]
MGLFDSIGARIEADYLQSKQGGLTGLAGLLKLIGGVGMMIVGAVIGAPALGIGAILGGMAGYFLGRYLLFVLIPLAILALIVFLVGLALS